jgi:hypothetical protein
MRFDLSKNRTSMWGFYLMFFINRLPVKMMAIADLTDTPAARIDASDYL